MFGWRLWVFLKYFLVYCFFYTSTINELFIASHRQMWVLSGDLDLSCLDLSATARDGPWNTQKGDLTKKHKTKIRTQSHVTFYSSHAAAHLKLKCIKV